MRRRVWKERALRVLVWLDVLLYDLLFRYESPWDRMTPEQQFEAWKFITRKG